MPKVKLEEEVISEIEEENYLVTEINYKNQKSKITIQHKSCGHIFQMDYDHWHNRGQRCPGCNKYSQKKTNSQFLEQVRELGLDKKYEFITAYETKRTPIKVKCLDCGNQMEMLPENIYKGRCRFCAASARREQDKLSLDEVRKELSEKFPTYELVSAEYHNNKTPLEFRCKICNSTFTSSLTNLRGGTRCPQCYSQHSRKEDDVKSFLESSNLTITKLHRKFNKHRIEFDMYNLANNVAVEFNGLYWHSDKFKRNNAMKEKLTWATSNGIRLINIFEDEWDYKKDIVKDKLLSIFGLNKKKIYARSCSIKPITASEKNAFLDANHIQGKDSASKYVGLFYDDELIAVMSFCKLRKNLGYKESPEGVYELSRFAGKLGYTVIGGFSKLLKYSIKNFQIKKIITYADLRWSSLNKNVYLENGFRLDHISAPSYSYLDKNCKKRLNRFSYRKSELKSLFPSIYSDEKSESDIMHEAGYQRIYDCGNACFIMEI